jgi:hypothetical protein
LIPAAQEEGSYMPLSETESRELSDAIKLGSDLREMIEILRAKYHWDESKIRTVIKSIAEATRVNESDLLWQLVGSTGQSRTGRATGRWEYQVFSETLGLNKYPENKKFWLDRPDGPWNIGRCPSWELAELIDKAARNLVQRVGAEGWELAEPYDANSLWCNRRVSYKDVSGFLDWISANTSQTIVPTAISINFRRWVQ